MDRDLQGIFIEAYRPARFLMVNSSLVHSEQIGETEVHWITPGTLAERFRQVFT